MGMNNKGTRERKPVRVQLSRRKGWRMPPNTVIVSRPTKWGNPFPVTAGRSAALARDLFHEALMHHHSLKISILDVEELRGKNLACWCQLGAPCHADVLLTFANV